MTEKDKLLNAYYQDQTIAPDGKLRPTFSRLVERADKTEAELTRLTALLEDRQLEAVLKDSYELWINENYPNGLYEFQADRLIAYLKPSLG